MLKIRDIAFCSLLFFHIILGMPSLDFSLFITRSKHDCLQRVHRGSEHYKSFAWPRFSPKFENHYSFTVESHSNLLLTWRRLTAGDECFVTLLESFPPNVFVDQYEYAWAMNVCFLKRLQTRSPGQGRRSAVSHVQWRFGFGSTCIFAQSQSCGSLGRCTRHVSRPWSWFLVLKCLLVVTVSPNCSCQCMLVIKCPRGYKLLFRYQ